MARGNGNELVKDGPVEPWDCERCSVQFRLPPEIVCDLEAQYIKSQANLRCYASDWIRHVVGAILGLLAGVFLTVGYLLSGFVQSMGPMQTCGIRSFFASLILLPFMAIFRPKLDVEFRTHLELIALSLVFGAKFIAFTVGSDCLPIGEFSLLANTVPIYTIALGCVFLRERCMKKTLACGIVSIGLVIVCLPSLLNDAPVDPRYPNRRATGYSSTLLSALTNAIALVWLRRLGSISAMWVALYASVMTTILSTILAALSDRLVFPDTDDLMLVAVAGLCTLMQTFLPAVACVLTEPSRVAISGTTAVVFAFVFQATVQRTAPAPTVYIGALLVAGAVLYCNVNWTCKKREEDEQALMVDRKSEMLYGAVALIGSPESSRLCGDCRLAT